jgi:phosphoglycerate kinase
MSVTEDRVSQVVRALVAPSGKLPLEQYLAAIPKLESLGDLPSGTPVLIRGDVDAKPGEKIGEGDVRLRSMVETLEFGRKKGWKQVIFGHKGRKPEESLN